MSPRVKEIIDYVEGGVAEDVGSICRKLFEIEEDELTKEEASDLDDNIFNCDQCNWTMPIDDRDEEEESDGFLCRDCASEDKNEEDE